MTVVEVPRSDEEVPETVQWGTAVTAVVFVPLERRYKGVDFIVARKTDTSVYVYFIQCTIQHPQEQGICESNLYERWCSLLKTSTNMSIQPFLVYLTPHGTNLNVPGPASMANFFSRKAKLHVQFAQVETDHTLSAHIKKQYPINTA